jgi:6-pyruvoyltetrahydropterin/6-carboxytetrahydropterin synthase
MGYLFEVGVIQEFEAAHKLKGDFGPSSFLHGHTYKVEVKVKGEKLDDQGVLFDLGALKESLNKVTGQLHCRYLNELEAFKKENPTAENVCKFIIEQLLQKINKDHSKLSQLKVTVWESSSAFASCQKIFK